MPSWLELGRQPQHGAVVPGVLHGDQLHQQRRPPFMSAWLVDRTCHSITHQTVDNLRGLMKE
eukprot:5340593-Alexandrium_andersonii.AAC.1